MVAVIVGATGLVGNILLFKLISDPRISKIIAVGRRSLAVRDSKLNEVIVSDLQELTKVGDSLVGDLYFCCLGTTIKKAGSKENFAKIDRLAVIDFAKVALRHQAKSFVVISALGADRRSNVFYSRVKGEVEQGLIDLGLSHLVIFRPGLLMGERRELRIVETVAIKVISLLEGVLPGNIIRKFATEASVLAEHMLRSSFTFDDKVEIIEAMLV